MISKALFLAAAPLFVLGLSSPSHADVRCSLLIDAATHAVLWKEGNECDVPKTPASTFKVALSVMGFDSGLLTDEEHPALPFKEGYADWQNSWKTTVTPRYWLEKSVVWYSQELTKKLGQERFQQYVNAFDYGNRDVSGDPGKDNGLTRAWLSSSLKITAIEEAAFIGKILDRKLPVSPTAIDMTMRIMPMTELGDGWRVYGKTGNGSQLTVDGQRDPKRQIGWFVGWAEKNTQRIIFVHLIEDTQKEDTYASLRSKDAFLASLPEKLRNLPQ